ncbi:MAG: SGNH/GDSL hydrolase family protein [Clostridia bacterium]|nr:SGNH/GDSL hydrolase family protein [Clostridia bacterium]
MKTILFQGDSITDCIRDRNPAVLASTRVQRYGTGYPFMVAARLATDYPGEYRFENRGVSGNRIVDLYARIKSDLLNLRPDYLTILIGVNDVWHEIGSKNGVDAEKFERIYRMLLDEVYAELPDVKVLLLTPFVLRGTATVDPEDPAKWETFSTEVKKRAEAVLRIAKDYPVSLTVTQPLFDEAEKTAPAGTLCHDGVHPSLIGNQILADAVLTWFESVK